MLDVDRLSAQLQEFSGRELREQGTRRERLSQALGALRACDSRWEDLQPLVEASRQVPLVARPLERPALAVDRPPRPTPVTVAATDGSQIYPDRNVEPACFVLNISRIAFQYGTLEEPLIESAPDFRDYVGGFDDDETTFETASRDLVSALRDDAELAQLFDLAVQVRLPGRPIVALADGTLIRWMLGGLRNRRLEQQLIGRYVETLGRFRAERIPVCSYISMPRNTEVVNLLRTIEEESGVDARPDAAYDGLMDRHLFERILAPGCRSAVFESASHIQRDYGADRICYFYLHVATPGGVSEIGRVEVPTWVAQDPAQLDLVHAVVADECEKGAGYPMILSEAHERAVIRAQEREQFYDLMERHMQATGLAYPGSRKAASKRRPVI